MRNRNRVNRLKVMSYVVLGILLYAFSVTAEQQVAESSMNNHDSQTENETKNMQPIHETEGSLYLGFRWIEGDTLSRAAQYEDPDSSAVFGFELDSYPLPHRFNILGEYRAPEDYYGDIGYAYKDIFLLRNILVGIHHNLDHYSYLHPGDPPGVTYADRSPGDANYVDFMKNDLLLRLKAPDFPLHAFVKETHVEREGSLQERFLIGYFGRLNKTAESRDIDWKSDDVTIGVNSHLGPIEVEYAHNRFEFDPGGGSVMYDFFAAGRPPDTYPHNVVPETEAYGNTLKLHTSYTGQIVASATLGNEESTNNYSGAESDSWKGAFDLQWIPDPTFGLFFRFRHLDMDKENPEHTILKGSFSRVSYEVRPPVSTDKDIFTLSARYRPLGRLTLNGKYEYEIRDRENVEEWLVLPENSDIHRVNLTARARFMQTLKLQAAYKYQYYENPAYNAEPDHYNKLRLKASFNPASWISALFDYSITITRRDDLLYVNGGDIIEGGERDGRTDRALASASFMLSPTTSLTASWAYNRWKIEQDTAYSQWDPARPGSVTALPYYDLGSPYTDDAHTIALTMHSKIRKDLKVKAGLSYTIAESEYLPNPSYLTVYTSRETRETILTVELAKQLLKDWEVGLKCKAGYFDDDYSSENADHQDGEMYVTILSLKRYF